MAREFHVHELRKAPDRGPHDTPLRKLKKPEKIRMNAIRRRYKGIKGVRVNGAALREDPIESKKQRNLHDNRGNACERVDAVALIESHGLFRLRLSLFDPLADLLKLGLDHLHLMLGDHRSMTEREHQQSNEYCQQDHGKPQVMKRQNTGQCDQRIDQRTIENLIENSGHERLRDD